MKASFEHLKTRGIFICNHASPLDIFLVMRLAPTGTVGNAKKVSQPGLIGILLVP